MRCPSNIDVARPLPAVVRRVQTAAQRAGVPDGSRLFGVMAVTARPSLSIRRHRYLKITPDDLIGMGTLDIALREFVGAAIRARKSCVICGGTAAGKTTLLRTMAADIPAWERLITIEDSLELGLDRYPDLHPDVVALEAREPNIEGEGGVSLAELVRWALRMSPDRVIVGEARGEEVLALLNAMSQGTDGSMTTLHASSSHEQRSPSSRPTQSKPRNAYHWKQRTCSSPTRSTSSSS